MLCFFLQFLSAIVEHLNDINKIKLLCRSTVSLSTHVTKRQLNILSSRYSLSCAIPQFLLNCYHGSFVFVN